MGLNAVLKDRARVTEKRALSVKVNGRTTFSDVTQPWFKARLEMPSAKETADPGGGRTRNEVRPTLIYGIKDTEGNPITVTTEMLVEVDSPQLGRAVFRPDEDPLPFRKKKRVIGYQVALRRVESHEFEEAVA